MDLSLFQQAQPRCPACLETGLACANTESNTIREGILLCQSCGSQFPVLTGTPVLPPDPARWLTDNLHLVIAREIEDAGTAALVGSLLGPETYFNIIRQQQASYAYDHYGDGLTASDAPTGTIRSILADALARLNSLPDGIALDLGCAVGRTTFDIAATLNRPSIGIDLNWGLLALARHVLDHKVVDIPLRRSGHHYERHRIKVDYPNTEEVDFWIADAMALPISDASIAFVSAMNIVDCVPEPARLLREICRVLVIGGRALIVTPLDWAAHATPPAQWIRGADELAALIEAAGLTITFRADVPWSLRLHDRALMQYRAAVYDCVRV